MLGSNNTLYLPLGDNKVGPDLRNNFNPSLSQRKEEERLLNTMDRIGKRLDEQRTNLPNMNKLERNVITHKEEDTSSMLDIIDMFPEPSQNNPISNRNSISSASQLTTFSIESKAMDGNDLSPLLSNTMRYRSNRISASRFNLDSLPPLLNLIEANSDRLDEQRATLNCSHAKIRRPVSWQPPPSPSAANFSRPQSADFSEVIQVTETKFPKVSLGRRIKNMFT